MQTYDVRRTFGTWVTGETADLDPDDDGTKALLRDGYITPVGEGDPDNGHHVLDFLHKHDD